MGVRLTALAVIVAALALAAIRARAAPLDLLRNLGRTYAAILLILLGVATVAIYLALRVWGPPPPAVPQWVQRARDEVGDIVVDQRAGLFEKSTSAASSQVFWRRELEIVLVENTPPVGPVLREFSAGNRRIAVELARGDTFVREYYDEQGCHFATDVYDKDYVQLILEYRRSCDDDFTRVRRDAPLFIPIAPPFGYGP